MVKLADARKAEGLIRSHMGQLSGTSGTDEIEKLASLKAKGIITEEEFTKKKSQLLGI
jgi:hypothetical protein